MFILKSNVLTVDSCGGESSRDGRKIAVYPSGTITRS